ncbi:MAG: citramalate synthase, partial [bacterium]|nr:citramalate synthase [bacterium]
MRPVEIYDVTLRDGAQGMRIKFSALDQLRIVQELDTLGVSYIEGGQPGSNPKAAELFARTKDMDLKHAKMAAFGSTRHPKKGVEDDPNLRALLAAETEVVTIFAKSSPLHVREVLRVKPDDNLRIIDESVRYLLGEGRRVVVDAEHFFDGYAEDSEYALSVLETAHCAGGEVLVLCDTNGGRLPQEITETTKVVRTRLPEARLGIHTHNDMGCAAANTLAAVAEGAVQIQGTINGYGERTGNANLCSIIPAVQLKMGIELVDAEQLASLSHVSHLVAELANMAPRDSDPFVGRDAFAHKGGMHADAVQKHKATYEHIQPELVGNRTHIAVSEVSGRASLLQKAAEMGIDLDRERPEARQILQRVKDLENRGYEFEGAEASLEILMRKATGAHRTFFTLSGYRVTVERHTPDGDSISEATVRLTLPDGSRMHTAGEGNGPVDALNNALRKALEGTYPELRDVHLEDYKVRILDAQAATRAQTRVLIESSDKDTSWDTVGVSENIITASYEALL